MLNPPYSRREILVLLRSTAALSAISMIAPAFITACNKTPSPDDQGRVDAGEEIIPCPSADLNEREIAIRNNLKYVDKTPIRTRTCDNCKLYKIARASPCGGCSVVPGPIHPKGWCSSWYYRM